MTVASKSISASNITLYITYINLFKYLPYMVKFCGTDGCFSHEFIEGDNLGGMPLVVQGVYFFLKPCVELTCRVRLALCRIK